MIDYPLNVYRGDTYAWQFRVWSDAAGTIPADLTGVLVAAEIRDKPGGTLILTLAPTITGNVIDLPLSAAVCRTLPAQGAWDLQLTFPSGHVHTIVAGRVMARADVTLATGAAA
jgi:hypothetical protein